jgi:toxin ParE1/3/4
VTPLRIRYSLLARLDLINHWEYFGGDSRAVADRFSSAIEKAVDSLAQFPLMGAELPLESPKAQGLRRWSARGFPNYLIVYRVTKTTIEIVRILHGARDLQRALSD